MGNTMIVHPNAPHRPQARRFAAAVLI